MLKILNIHSDNVALKKNIARSFEISRNLYILYFSLFCFFLDTFTVN